MNKFKNVLTMLFLLSATLAIPFHANATASSESVSKPVFELASADKKFDKIALTLASQKINIKNLHRAIDQLDKLSDQAQDCVVNTTAQINEIDSQIKEIIGRENASKERVDAQYLEKQKTKLADRQAKCQLFMIRANEALSLYRNRMLSLRQQITFTRGYTIFKRAELVHDDIQKLVLPEITDSLLPWGGIVTGLLATTIAIFATVLIRGMRSGLRKVIRRRLIGFSQIFFVFMGLSAVFLWIANYSPFIEDSDNILFQQILVEIGMVAVAMLATQLIMGIRRFDIALQWYGFAPDFLRKLIQFIILLSGISLIGSTSLTLLGSGQDLKQFYSSMMMMVSLLATIYFSYYFFIKHQRFLSDGQIKVVNRIIWGIVFTLVALDLAGFYVLAANAARVFFSLLLISGLSLVLLKGLGQAYHYLNYAPKAQASMKYYFGYQTAPPYFELALLKVIIQIIIILGLFYLFAYLIGEINYFIDNFLNYIINGFKLAGLAFRPMLWLIGLFVFCVIVILFRYISRRYSLQSIKDGEEETQVALASILLYVGFTFAIIMGLLVAGFSFTSLAIIAGALSVGIGLGLQSIVNNFFSGLILLIEKPIKAGDRISINGVEGFVKKVRVRSTQIETPANEDIIVPNSDLITQQVTNFMFSDNSWRVKCSVGVAYGSDIELVRQVLLDIARNHNEVLNTRGQKPRVLFREFADSSLVFELWCMISDVNNKYNVASDLNFAIDKAFRAQNIEIAFPQRDVHIKFDPAKRPPDEDIV